MRTDAPISTTVSPCRRRHSLARNKRGRRRSQRFFLADFLADFFLVADLFLPAALLFAADFFLAAAALRTGF
jgi:hypothetical protein